LVLAGRRGALYRVVGAWFTGSYRRDSRVVGARFLAKNGS